MSANEDNKWRRRQSTQNNSASPSPTPSQNYNQSRRSDSRSSSFQSQNNRSFSNNTNNSSGYSGGMVDEHAPVNGFNAKELRDLLSKGYTDAVAGSQAAGDDKPVVYKNNDKGWTTQSKSSPWGQKQHTMANGVDFLTRLRKGVSAQSTNGGSKDGKFGG
ncbi:hypothetical protein TWF730_008345 [Orbilia blumenaviensis]|uniref:Uncharacterized protein n=1 Tax=Orbilia blumenaviensis TaxID=1796055 RepID=A0AAV9V2W2_9PEZI